MFNGCSQQRRKKALFLRLNLQGVHDAQRIDDDRAPQRGDRGGVRVLTCNTFYHVMNSQRLLGNVGAKTGLRRYMYPNHRATKRFRLLYLAVSKIAVSILPLPLRPFFDKNYLLFKLPSTLEQISGMPSGQMLQIPQDQVFHCHRHRPLPISWLRQQQ